MVWCGVDGVGWGACPVAKAIFFGARVVVDMLAICANLIEQNHLLRPKA